MDKLKYCLPVSSPEVKSKTNKHQRPLNKWDPNSSNEKKILRKLRKQSQLCFACAIHKQIQNEKHINYFHSIQHPTRKIFLFQTEIMHTMINGIVFFCLITIFCSQMVSSENPNSMLNEKLPCEFTNGMFYNCISFFYYTSKMTVLTLIVFLVFLWINTKVKSRYNATERDFENLVQNTKKMFIDEKKIGLKDKILVKKMKVNSNYFFGFQFELLNLLFNALSFLSFHFL